MDFREVVFKTYSWNVRRETLRADATPPHATVTRGAPENPGDLALQPDLLYVVPSRGVARQHWPST